MAPHFIPERDRTTSDRLRPWQTWHPCRTKPTVDTNQEPVQRHEQTRSQRGNSKPGLGRPGARPAPALVHNPGDELVPHQNRHAQFGSRNAGGAAEIDEGLHPLAAQDIVLALVDQKAAGQQPHCQQAKIAPGGKAGELPGPAHATMSSACSTRHTQACTADHSARSKPPSWATRV